ncbi:MAG: hypothetical protein NTY02_09310 [Acidobacteria bacterium]|nr:hypothetical protein [Acidobacteriota bacterium]
MDDFVTGAEFGRFRADFSSYQTREAALLEAMEGRIVTHIDARVDGIDDRLDILNGQTKKNSEAVAVHTEQILAIQVRGCGQLAAHRGTLESLRPDPDVPDLKPWHRDKRTWTGTGMGIAGVTVLYSLARLFEAVTQHVVK